MKKIFIFLFCLMLTLFYSSDVIACNCGNDYIVRVKLAINDQTQICQPFIYEAFGGFYKKMPDSSWRLVNFDNSDYIYLEKYCESINYQFVDRLLIPTRWELIRWKFIYSIVSLIAVSLILAFPFIKIKRKKKV